MGLFGNKKEASSHDERYAVLELAKDEDYQLSEFVQRIGGDSERLKSTIADLLSKKMLEMFVISPDRERRVLTPDQATNAATRPEVWLAAVPGKDKFLLSATDKGWRWHEKNWRA